MKRIMTILVLLLQIIPTGARATLDIDGELSFSRAKITLVNGKHYLAKHVTMEGDSISLARVRMESVGYQPVPPSAFGRRNFSLDDVSRIDIPDGNYAALGAGIGALAGFAFWGLAANASNEPMWGGVVLAIPFMIVPGAGIGALVGSGVENWEPVYTRDQR
jgi:hypothetical protein